jgi:IclR family transcriptional regulator, pca regulon regulatory protein
LTDVDDFARFEITSVRGIDTAIEKSGIRGPSRPAGANFITSLANGLSVLEAVADNVDDIPLVELAKRVGLEKTRTRRLVHTLVDLGYLHQDPRTRNFRPSARVLTLGYAYFDSLDLKRLSLPFLLDLSARHNETVNLAVLDGDELTYVEHIQSAQIVTVNFHVGSRLPLYSTSLGRALMCEMPDDWVRQYIRRIGDEPNARKYVHDGAKRIWQSLRETRERGYALNDEEVAKGLRAISCPVRDRTSKIVAAVCISVPSSRCTVAELRKSLAPDLLDVANKVSLALGYRRTRNLTRGAVPATQKYLSPSCSWARSDAPRPASRESARHSDGNNTAGYRPITRYQGQ